MPFRYASRDHPCAVANGQGANASSGPGDSDRLILSLQERLARIAALWPPPRLRRHRYYGALAPHSPLRSAITALAEPAA